MPIRSLKDIPNSPKCDQKVPDDFAQQHPNVLFAGRLGQYKYMDMDETILIYLKQ